MGTGRTGDLGQRVGMKQACSQSRKHYWFSVRLRHRHLLGPVTLNGDGPVGMTLDGQARQEATREGCLPVTMRLSMTIAGTPCSWAATRKCLAEV